MNEAAQDTSTTNASSGGPQEFTAPPGTGRWAIRALIAVFAAALGFGLGGHSYGLLLGLLFLVVVLLIPVPRFWSHLRINGSSLEYRRADDHAWRSCPALHVMAILSEAGINKSGQSLIFCKQLRLITDQSSLYFQFDPTDNLAAFSALLAACPLAVGIAYDGRLHVPPCPPDHPLDDWYETSLGLIRDLLHRQFRLSLAKAAVGMVFTVLVIGLLILILSGPNSSSHGISTVGEIAFVLAVFAPVYTVYVIRRHLAAMRALADAAIAPRLYAQPFAPPPPLAPAPLTESLSTRPPSIRRAVILTTLAFFFTPIPVLGLAFAIWALLKTRRGPYFLWGLSLLLTFVGVAWTFSALLALIL